MATENGRVKRCQNFCMRVSMLVALVAVLLGAMCLIMLRFPEKDLEMASTDMRLVEAVSNVWCGGQEFVSAHPFSVYRVSAVPLPPTPAAVNHIHHVIELNTNIHSGKFHYLRYYLLPGSNVTVDVAADGPGGTIHVVRGEEELKRCIRALQEDDDDDFSDEVDYYEDGSIRRRQPSFYRWAMKSKRIASELSGGDFTNDVVSSASARLTFKASAADLYYVLLVNENRPPLSSTSVLKFRIKIDLNRTVFGVTPQDVVCLEQTHCVYHVHFGAEDRLILHVPRERDAGNAIFTITTSCRPRVFFYALLFILIPILFLVFLGAVIRAFSYLANTSNEDGKYLRFRLFRDEETARRRQRDEPVPPSQQASAEELLVCHLPGIDPPRTPPPCYSSLNGRGDPVPESESLLLRPVPVVQPPRYSEVLQQEQLMDSLQPEAAEQQATTSAEGARGAGLGVTLTIPTAR